MPRGEREKKRDHIFIKGGRDRGRDRRKSEGTKQKKRQKERKKEKTDF